MDILYLNITLQCVILNIIAEGPAVLRLRLTLPEEDRAVLAVINDPMTGEMETPLVPIGQDHHARLAAYLDDMSAALSTPSRLAMTPRSSRPDSEPALPSPEHYPMEDTLSNVSLATTVMPSPRSPERSPMWWEPFMVQPPCLQSSYSSLSGDLARLMEEAESLIEVSPSSVALRLGIRSFRRRTASEPGGRPPDRATPREASDLANLASDLSQSLTSPVSLATPSPMMRRPGVLASPEPGIVMIL